MKAGMFLSVVILGFTGADAATYTVNSTNDTGPGSFRQALLDANAHAGTDTIAFAITNAALTISPASALPIITDSIVIDGTTQPGFSNAPLVELYGQTTGTGIDGLTIAASDCIVRGLAINRFSRHGIVVTNGENNQVEGNYVGLNLAGTSDYGNSQYGILLTNAANNVIGGTNDFQRNKISGNNQGGIAVVGVLSTGNVILGNTIGLSGDGSYRIGNGNGVYINVSPGNRVGGVRTGERNIISGNSTGIRIEGTNATANVVQGNFIGTDLSGTVAQGNGNGVQLLNAPTNFIGGAGSAAGNLISGNSQNGIRLEGAPTRGNRIQGNSIGPDVTGLTDLGNSSEGVYFTSLASFNSVGGTNAGEANVIAFNNGDGVSIFSGTNNSVRANTIFENNGLGIDLNPNGVTPNDAGDADTGPNNLQNYPILSAATNMPASVIIVGALNSAPSSSFTIDFYANQQPDASTNGEGQFYLGSTNVTTDADGNAPFVATLPRTLSGRFVSATATDPDGNTSEFSPCIRAASLVPALLLTVTTTNDGGPGSLRQAIRDANSVPANTNHVVHFAIPGSGLQTISPASALPTIVEPLVLDGFTQPGASANNLSDGNNAVWLIRLDGAGAGNGANGLRFVSDGNVVRGLMITRFNSDGIELDTNRDNVIAGNCLGLDESGADQGNNSDGVFISNSSGNRIGGSAPGGSQRHLRQQ